MLWLHTQGNLIKNSMGQVVNLSGGGVEGLEWGWSDIQSTFKGNWNEDYISFFKANRGIFLRLALSFQPVDSSYLALVDEFVGWCRKHGVYVVLDCHMGDPDVSDKAGEKLTVIQNPTTPFNQIIGSQYSNLSWVEWLQMYADRYKNEPTVCAFNIFNEPAEQQLPPDQLFPIWRNAASIAVDGIHSINPKILCGVWGMYWGNSLQYWNADPLLQPNVYYCAARYMYSDFGGDSYADKYARGDYAGGYNELFWTYEWQKYFELAAKKPVVMMEWGAQNVSYDAALEPHYLKWMEDNLILLKEHGIGQVYWTYSGSNINDGDLLKYDEWQNGLKALSTRGELWSQHLQPLPTPNLMSLIKGISRYAGPVAAGLVLARDSIFKRRG